MAVKLSDLYTAIPDASGILMSSLPGSTYNNVQQMQNIFHSAGWSSGGAITDQGGGTIRIAAGTGFIRATNNRLAEILYFDWPQVDIAVGLGEVRYFGIEYNAGTPQGVARVSDAWDLNTEFPIGSVVRESDGTVHIETSPQAVGDHANFMIQRALEVTPISRDNLNGGLGLGETGTRNVTLSGGALWKRLNRSVIAALDTSVADTFDSYYRDGVGGWTKQSAQTQWPNTLYDDNTGTLAAITASNYGVLWFYVELDGNLVMLYGRGDYASDTDAKNEGPPADLPPRVATHGKLLGRFIFQESAGTALAIESIFDTAFSGGAAITDHNLLSNLTVGDPHTQYQLISQKGVANGYASLDGTGVVPGSELPPQGGQGIIGTPDDGDFNTGLSGILTTDNIATAVDKVDEFVATVAQIVAPAPGTLAGQTLTDNATKYSGKIPSGLSGAWVETPGTSVNGVIYNPVYQLNSPDLSTRFLAGTVLGGQASAGQLTHVLDGVDGDVHDIAANGVGSTGTVQCTALVAHNAVFQRANGRINYTQPGEGKARHALKHTQSGQTNEKVFYYDDANTVPTFAVAPTQTVDTEVTKYLSGIQYYINGTVLLISFTGAVGVFEKVYRTSGVATIYVSNGGAPNIDVDPVTVPAYNDQFVVTNQSYPIAGDVNNNNPILNVRLRKPNNQQVIAQTNPLARKIARTTSQSTSTIEHFTDEDERLVLNTDTPWTPSATLIDGNAQVYNGTLEHPVNGDYPAFVAAEQEYQRKIAKTAASSGTLSFTGIAYTDINPYGTGDLNVLLQLDGDGVFFDLGRVVGDDNGTGDGLSRANSKGARVSGSSGIVNFSFLTYSTGGVNNNEYRVIIIFRNTNHSIGYMAGS